MKPPLAHRRRSQLLWTTIFVAVLAAVAILFLEIFAPAPYDAPVAFERSYDRTRMQAALAPEAVRETLDEIEALGSRAPGQPGHEATYELLQRRYREAGLECLTHEFDVPYPRS